MMYQTALWLSLALCERERAPRYPERPSTRTRNFEKQRKGQEAHTIRYAAQSYGHPISARARDSS